MKARIDLFSYIRGKGMLLKDVVAGVPVSYTTLGRVVNGGRISYGTARAIANYLGSDIDELFVKCR